MTKETSRKRLDRTTREKLIVEEAIKFFAEFGFEGRTRDLAKRIGITQPLLYSYFPNKESLIERVYQEVYLQRWNPEWEGIIGDRDRPLEERLCEFYKAYSGAVFDYVWVRIFIYSGLKDVNINDRYLSIIREKILEPICIELRNSQGLPKPTEIPLSDTEIELAWGLHGAFFYRAIRHYVYNLPLTENLDKIIENDVRIFLKGAPEVQRQILCLR